MEVHMPFELTEREKVAIRTISIERMINTTIRLVERLRRSSNSAIAEDACINWQDWREQKALLVKLWDREREAIFQDLMKGRMQDTPQKEIQ
jgi:hypothetical protein